MNTALAYLNHYPARLSQNPIVINVEAADPTLFVDRSGLRYYCQVMIPESYLAAAYKRLVKLEAAEQPPVPAGAGQLYQGAFFDIQNQLDPLLERTAPEFNQMRISVADRLVMPYYCILSVENDDEAVSELMLAVDYVVKAGINEVDYAAYKDLFFTEFIGANRRFLTWAPNPKTVLPDQPEQLYFLTNFSPAPSRIRVCYEATFSDYSVVTSCPLELDNIFPYTGYCIPTGPKALGLDQHPKELLSYYVWLENENSERISEIRYYKMDQEYRRNVRFIVFANSLGGFDTLPLVGQGEESLSFQRSISERFAGWEFLPSYSEREINAVTGQRELSVATGWLSKDALRYLEELQFSKEVYLVTDRAFVPLVPSTGSIRPAVDDEDLIGRTLTFQFANQQTNYSELPDPGTLTQRATGWRPKATACLLDASGRRTGQRQATVLEQYYLDDGKKVVGARLKANVPGTVGYIPPITSEDCAVTPYLNTVISRSGTYRRRGCPAPLQGGPATITIAAGSFGSEVSQADAQAKAEAEFRRINTQLYADANGVCLLEPEKYEYNVPAGQWHYRANDPALVAMHWLIQNDPDGRHPIGNAWMVQGQGGPWIYPMGSNDLNFPISYGTPGWRMLVFGAPGTSRRVKIYQNGVLKMTYTVTINRDGFEYVTFGSYAGQSFTLATGDKMYVVNEPA